jgi:hypothetical protein
MNLSKTESTSYVLPMKNNKVQAVKYDLKNCREKTHYIKEKMAHKQTGLKRELNQQEIVWN